MLNLYTTVSHEVSTYPACAADPSSPNLNAEGAVSGIRFTRPKTLPHPIRKEPNTLRARPNHSIIISCLRGEMPPDRGKSPYLVLRIGGRLLFNVDTRSDRA